LPDSAGAGPGRLPALLGLPARQNEIAFDLAFDLAVDLKTLTLKR